MCTLRGVGVVGKGSIRRRDVSSGLLVCALYLRYTVPRWRSSRVLGLGGGFGRERVGCWGSRRAVFSIQAGVRSVRALHHAGMKHLLCGDRGGRFKTLAPL